MCGRIVWIWDAATGRLLRKIVDDPERDPAVDHVLRKRRYNVPPASHLPVIDGRGAPQMTVAKWGFPIPQRPNGVFNTRIETALESPMWRGLVGQSHCLWPVAGFYEWHRGRRRTPFFIHRADGDPMLIAGVIQDRAWQGEAKTFGSMLTCAPNAVMVGVHDRMPVVVEPDDARAWLDADVDTALRLAVPAADDVLTMHRVGPDVGDTKNDHAELMEPVENQGLGAFT